MLSIFYLPLPNKEEKCINDIEKVDVQERPLLRDK